MEDFLLEWGSLLIRWVHVVAGIAWIGSSFYFMHIDAAMRATPDIPADKGGEAWEVHGGGFYRVRKYLVAPEKLPDHLIWHKWEAYTTWITGFFLLVWIYYLGAELYLIDPQVRELSPLAASAVGIAGLAVGWFAYDLLCKSPVGRNDNYLAAACFVLVVGAAVFFQSMFSGRGALIHTGAFIATIMSANVFRIIIPNQKVVIADLVAGRTPDPELGRQAKQRSAHNNYLTLPVLFLMMSGHYPMTFSTDLAFVIVALVLVAGALVRVFYNLRNAGKGNAWWTWVVAALCMLVAMGISLTSVQVGRELLSLESTDRKPKPVKLARAPEHIFDIVAGRCSMCHNAEPFQEGVIIAPKGIALETPELVARYAKAIYIHSVLSNSMPPNNVSAMTQEERRAIAVWYRSRGTRKQARD